MTSQSADVQLRDPGLQAALCAAQRVVVFSGAGVSAESGIATFRDSLIGLWQNFDPARLATVAAFEQDPELVWGWYEWRRMQVLAAQPNAAHLAIAALANSNLELTVITQNVDDLHERAGSAQVLHLHGSLHQPRCHACGEAHRLPPEAPSEPSGGRRLPPPICAHCAGMVRPGVVWFGEALPEHSLQQAFETAADCDLLLSVGTSGVVYPAAQVPEIALRSGAAVIHINPQPELLGGGREWALAGPAGESMPRLVKTLLSK